MISRQTHSERRRDFLDPDFAVKTSVNLVNRRRSKCRVNSELGTEIPALGLDSAQLGIDCDINPLRVAGAALKVARAYNNHRRERYKQRRQPSSSSIKNKRTKITIDSEHRQARHHDDDDDD